MNKGIKNYFKMLTNTISNDTKSLININKEYANFHILIDLYKSRGPKPIPLSLIYTLSEKDVDMGFGNGIKINFYNKLKVNKTLSPVTITETKFDGSSIEYIRVGDTNYYKNNEEHTQIHDCWNIYEIDDSWLFLTDKYSNKYTYDYHYLTYPQKIEMKNGNVFNFNVNSTKIYEIDDNSKEKIIFEYELNSTIIRIKYNSVEIYRIELYFDNNKNLTDVKKYKGSELVSHVKYDFSLTSADKYIKITDKITNYRILYALDNENKVINVKSGYDDIYVNKSTIQISYYDNYTRLSDSMNKENMFFFDDEGKLLYTVDNESKVKNFEYNSNNELVNNSNLLCNDKEYVISQGENLIKDGFLTVDIGEWGSEGNGSSEVITDSSNPITSLGDKVMKLVCNEGQYVVTQNIELKGNPNEQLTFAVWGKKINIDLNDSNSKVSVRVKLQSNGGNILTKTLSFDNNLSIWQYKTMGLKVDSTYNNVLIEIVLTGVDTQFAFNGVQLYKRENGIIQQYDSDGNIISKTNGNNSSNKEYDENNLISFNSGVNLETLSYIYDERNNPIHVGLPYGAKIVREYDGNNRIVNEQTIYENEYMERINEYDVSTGQTNVLKNVNYNYSGKATETYFDEMYRTISKIKYPTNVEKEFVYDSFENLLKMIVKKDNDSLSIEYEYDTNNLLKRIKMPSYNYKIVYDNDSRPIQIIYESGSNTAELIEVNYLTKSNNGTNISTNLIEFEKFGTNGDSYFFEYNDENKIKIVSLIKRNSDIKTPQFSFEYNKYGKVIKIINLQFTPFLETNFEYDLNGNIVSIFDNEDNVIYYSYNLENSINTKVYKNNEVYNAFSLNAVDRSRGITSETLSEGLKRDGEYVCFFNCYEKDSNQIVVSKKLSKLGYDYNQEQNVLYNILPTKGNTLVPSLKEGIGCIEYENTILERLQYLIDPYANFEYPNGSFMFWFKIEQYQNGSCLMCFGDDTTKEQIYVMFENNSLALYVTDSSGFNYKLLYDIGNIVLNEWNYVGISFHNRYDGDAYDNICKYTLQLNGTQKVYQKTNPRLYVDIPLSCPVAIGCKLSGDNQILKFNGFISALMFGEGKYSGEYLDKYYRLCKEYVFRKIHTDSICKTLYSSSVDKYEICNDGVNILDNYKIFPLHNSLNSLNGESPLKYSERSTIYYDKDKQFNYDEQTKRYVYVCDGQQLIYNSYNEENSDSGIIALKIKMSDSIYDNYIFQGKDSNGKTLGLFRKSTDNKVYIELNGTHIDSGFSINDMNWHFIGLTWSKVLSSGSLTSYAYNLRIQLDDGIIDKNCDVSFTFTNLFISIGRKYDYESGTCLPLYGCAEMLIIGDTYASNNTLLMLKEKSLVSTLSKHYNSFGLLELISYTKDDKSIARIEYQYLRDNNKLSTLIGNEKIITNSKEQNNEYKYDIGDRLVEVKKSNKINRVYDYNYLGYLIKDENRVLNKKFIYDYDALGNIISKKEYNYDTEELIKNNIYQYDSSYPTLLSSYNDKILQYNDTLFGNPTSYGTADDKFTFEWNGKKLSRVLNTSRNLEISYKYNDKGLRIRKTINGLETRYFYEGKNLISEKNNDCEKYYFYDESDTIFGFGLKNNNEDAINNYYFIRDINGVITGIINSNGDLVVEYEYDAFGQIMLISGILSDTIGSINNILYKGYYYDFEMKMFYLKARYYVPEWGRFLNSDDPRLLAFYSSLNVNRNLFAYCNNDPIQNMDENGQWFKKFLQKVWSWLKSLIPVEVTVSGTKEEKVGNTYVTTTVGKKYVGSSWSVISVDVATDMQGNISWNVGLGSPISFNFGNGGVSFKAEAGFFQYSAEASVGLTENGNVFAEAGYSYENSNNEYVSVITGSEADVDWDKLAYELTTVIVVAGCVVGFIAGIAAAANSGGASLGVSYASAMVLIAMISNENNTGDNTL